MSDLVFLKEKAKNYSVLLVEDSMHIQKQMKNFLGKLFGTVFIANNGLEGLELFKKNLPDIIISDLTMPKMDGHEFVERVFSINSAAQVIIVSAHGYEENVIKFKKMGVCEFIQKPVDFSVLIMALIKGIKNLETTNEVEEIIIEDGILKRLYELKQENQKVELINHYKGLPLVHDGSISSVTKDSVGIKTEQMHVKIVKIEKSTYIKIDGDTYSAKLDSYDPFAQELIFIDLKEEERTPDQREFVRVEPDSLFNSSIFFHSERFNFEITSVSSKAIAFIADRTDNKLQLGDEADIVLGFKTVYKASYENEITHKERLTCKGKVIKFYMLSNERVKIVFSLSLSLGNRKILEKYISQRQVEIIKEFKTLKV